MSDHRQRDILAKTIYAEARGESDEGQEAVGHVIMNRAQANKPYWGGNTIEGVCRHPNQFECWNNKNDIEINEPDAYQRSRTVADKVLSAPHGYDPTGGADHYNNPAKEPDATWPAKCTHLKDIGGHRFYKGPQ